MLSIRCSVNVPLLLLLGFLLAAKPSVFGSSDSCLSYQYQCADGECIPGIWKCDGDRDCPNGEDEAACSEVVPCAGFRCSDGRCVSIAWRCDGYSDCTDSSDEDPLICGNITCPSDKFRCHNGGCVSAKLVCNGQNDCTDHSDEAGCPVKQCPSDQFLCGSACMSASVICNGEMDCPGGEDESEERCKLGSSPQCSEAEFSCDEECVPLTWRCDGHTDCEDETDEQDCVSEPLLLVFNSKRILKLDLTGENRENVELALGKISAITGDLGSSDIFWMDGERRSIYRKPFDKESNRREIVNHLGNVTSLSIDWIYKLIYWIDSESRTVYVSSLDGSKRRVLYKDRISSPTALAVDPLTGFIFWSDMGEDAKIEKAAMNGNTRISLVTLDIYTPVALTLDIKRSFVYWMDSELNSISRISMDGLHRKKVIHSELFLAKPSGIAVFEDRIFWSDMKREAIYSMSRRLHANVTKVTSMNDPAGLIILAREVQADSVNLCLELMADCPFLCVPSPLHPEHFQAFSCLSSDSSVPDHVLRKPLLENSTSAEQTEVSYKGSFIAVLENSTSAEQTEVSYKGSLIAVLVVLSFSLVFGTIVWCQAKNFLNKCFFEKSKQYLKPDRERFSSTAYMLTDLKTEEEYA
ncbi:CD320 antigen isoform X2 [Bombina bombina]|uniref:CD320 antigen isoform X2 n=1 Tax=Bombina bombina TaxID=8345 RepID=UPI00235A6747|nr:CD320 antigen isoform X2 [Bombina bombina]